MKPLLLFSTAAILLTGCSCDAQTKKPTPVVPKAEPEFKSQAVTDGKPCFLDGLTYSNVSIWVNGSGFWGQTEIARDSKQHIDWHYTYGELWSCTANKWVRDIAGEKKRDEHNEFVGKVRAEITKRKLTDVEFAVIDEALNGGLFLSGSTHIDMGGVFSCSGAGCSERYECEASSNSTATLIAQVSFYNPPDEDLPLKYLKSYIKGMNCDAGVNRAYQIMNERILAYLKKQHPSETK